MEKIFLKQPREGIRIITRSDGRIYPVRENRDRFFYPDEWGKFFDKLWKSQKFTFKFLINTGARINEARNVRIEDIDLERRRLVLRVTKIRAKKKETAPRPRIIPLSTQFTKYLKKQIAEWKKDYKIDDKEYIPILSTAAANQALKKGLIKAGVKDWYMFSIHNIRKTLETWLMALNVDGLKITAHIGHSMAVAARSYISPDVFAWEEKKQMRMIIGDLYER